MPIGAKQREFFDKANHMICKKCGKEIEEGYAFAEIDGDFYHEECLDTDILLDLNLCNHEIKK